VPRCSAQTKPGAGDDATMMPQRLKAGTKKPGKILPGLNFINENLFPNQYSVAVYNANKAL
jgi:hypothetical protein